MKISALKGKSWLCAVVGSFFALGSMVSWGSCQPLSAATTFIIDVPSTLIIPRDTPIGAEVYRSKNVSIDSAPKFNCTTTESSGYKSVGYTSSSGPSPLGSSGLGWRMLEDDLLVAPYPNGARLPANQYTFNGTAGIVLYKMAEFSTLSAQRLGSFVVGGTDMYYLEISNSIQPLVASCQTPSVDVPLGKQFSNKFTGVGSTIGEKAFSIQLNDCPAGINSISYRLDPINTPLDAENGILSLDSGGATGVGIKITDSNGSAIGLGKTINFLSNAAAGNYTIPLKAAYYKTSDTVVGGAANASMQFTITYQ